MPISQPFSHLKRYVNSYKNNGNGLKKITQFTTGLGVGGTLAALPAATTNFNSNVDKVADSISGFIRFFRSLKIGLWISLDYYFSMMGLNESSPNYNAMMSRIHQRAADGILNGCLKNGGSYIKLGQGLVSMSHILPREYIQTLRALQDKCLTRKEGELRQLFLEDLGKQPSDIFKSFDPNPIAAASIAQVYKATTQDGQNVAVKVQYIDLRKRFYSDIATINILLKIAAFMHPTYNFSWVMSDLEGALEQELDFITEALNSERCARDLRHLNYIHVPKVYWDYTSPVFDCRVLVTEFIDGFRINDVEKLRENKFCLIDIVTKMFEAFGYQVFKTGFVHADPHSGNVLVRKHNGIIQLVLLDHGLYEQLSDEDRISLSHMWKAIVLRNHEKMKKYSKQLGVDDYEMFAEILTQAPLKSHNFKLKVKLTEEDLKRMTDFARERFDSIMKCLRNMPSTLLLVIRNLNTIRAIAHDLGNPVDRYAVLARAATRRVYDDKSIAKRILHFPYKLYFEMVLQFHYIGVWITSSITRILTWLGMVPDVNVIMARANISNKSI